MIAHHCYHQQKIMIVSLLALSLKITGILAEVTCFLIQDERQNVAFRYQNLHFSGQFPIAVVVLEVISAYE